MRNLISFILLVCFGLGAFIGFSFASQVSNLEPVKESPNAIVSQFNILIVGMEKDAQGQNRLASAWVALVKVSGQTTLIFKKIYPDLKNEADRNETRAGRLIVTDNRLPEAFEKKIAPLHLQFTEQLFVDRSNLASIAPFFGGKVALAPASKPQQGDLTISEEVYLGALCKSLTESAAEAADGSTPSAEQNWMDPWKGLVTSLHFSRCDVMLDP